MLRIFETPFQLTSDLEQVKGHKRERITMNVLPSVVCFLSLAIALFAQDSAGPVITVRKGTSQQVEVRDIGGPAG
ncbi:MAG TPA: hypothetical protein VJX28_04010, partial [Chthoniobacterales bacterium]|nr:hypothetical protein [Chthoniobacterales bacterium]